MSFATANDDDSHQRFALGLVFAIVLLVVSTVVGTVVVQRGLRHAPAVAGAAQAAPTVVAEIASVRVDDGVVKFYFATNSAAVAAGGADALADVVRGVAAGRKVAVSGFHDATGDAARNEELAKQRAFAVRDALKALGVTEAAIELRRPEVSIGSGPAAEARRVEVMLLPN
ncbi:OmpA family protein [Ramlibacter sp. H39-3-26]|uniref:OmpA family protein n=1 Tax=Curvibacter soli TaxID=3031331 RepID=UPI0023DA5919|nr:OmpA family protein [Ramlibacter sp. H39-3-26]MDF1486604.1 OmpA family protein [Ramlibacter sp. H39-3-26]